MCCMNLTEGEQLAAHRPTGETIAPHALHERIDNLAADVADRVVEWRHHLHRHPELHDDGSITPTPGGRGIVINHNPAFYADDSILQTGVRLHANVALDHLTGQLAAGR
jgi:metal-dependent amidase/aminoacylase/carboxypeptidase family protein